MASPAALDENSDPLFPGLCSAPAAVAYADFLRADPAAAVLSDY